MIPIHQTEEQPGKCDVLHFINTVNMKNKLILTALLFVCFTAANAQASNYAYSLNSTNESKARDTDKKNTTVSISPNPSYTGDISVTSKSEQELHFYIFDLEGTLIYQTVLKTKEKKAINSLNKGTYMYNVFANDESIEEGKLIIK
jgi:hypothetical protein